VHPWGNTVANVMVRTRAAITSARLFGLMFNALAFSRRPIVEKKLLNADG
jgi:ABC-type Co2+ transport system permease subunit